MPKPDPTTRLLGWLRRHVLWFRDPTDTLGRVYAVCEVARSILAVHAITVNLLIVAPRATSPVGCSQRRSRSRSGRCSSPCGCADPAGAPGGRSSPTLR
ncbi:hypothetical protein G7085_03170 [Tessaracoccus sp. HDW20]|uniref:hypothetical protein n=1 Tax=Tessaracoccus coleopterorum TaxID=2714950 RepID=UPI0018D2A393|nr:hypothetical protein [Tessaracoccus coleopterorum]NHB84002.1 hypothetical protein [Tessaracoccus coleopterorum]